MPTFHFVFLLLVLISGYILLWRKSISADLRSNNPKYEQILFEEYCGLSRLFLMAAFPTLVLYVIAHVSVQKPTLELQQIVRVLDWLDTINGYLSFELSAWLSLGLIATTILLARFVGLGRHGSGGIGVAIALTLLRSVPVFMRTRGIYIKTQVVLLFLTSVTFFGGSGGPIKEVTYLQLSRATVGVAELEQIEQETAAAEIAQQLIDTVQNQLETSDEIDWEPLDPLKPSLYSSKEASIKLLQDNPALDNTLAKRRHGSFRSFFSLMRFSASQVANASANERAARVAASGTNEEVDRERFRDVKHSLSTVENVVRNAQMQLDRRLYATETTANTAEVNNAIGEFRRLFVEAVAGSLITGTHSPAINALVSDIPFLKPFADTLDGAIQRIALDNMRQVITGSTSIDLRAPLSIHDGRVQTIVEKASSHIPSMAGLEPPSTTEAVKQRDAFSRAHTQLVAALPPKGTRPLDFQDQRRVRFLMRATLLNYAMFEDLYQRRGRSRVNLNSDNFMLARKYHIDYRELRLLCEDLYRHLQDYDRANEADKPEINKKQDAVIKKLYDMYLYHPEKAHGPDYANKAPRRLFTFNMFNAEWNVLRLISNRGGPGLWEIGKTLNKGQKVSAIERFQDLDWERIKLRSDSSEARFQMGQYFKKYAWTAYKQFSGRLPNELLPIQERIRTKPPIRRYGRR